jgi:Oxidoreductase molybdopterin binding domain
MNRTASLMVPALAAALLHGQIHAQMLHAQAIREPKAFPPDIGPAAITVTGIGGKSIQISMADLVNFPRHTVKTADHGSPVEFEGILLKDVLSRVALPTGEEFHKTAAACYLVVEAADGYRAVFAWAELDESIMDKPVYLVTHRNGKPLSSTEGPFELVAPGEKRNARWVHQVTALTLRSAG